MALANGNYVDGTEVDLMGNIIITYGLKQHISYIINVEGIK